MCASEAVAEAIVGNLAGAVRILRDAAISSSLGLADRLNLRLLQADLDMAQSGARTAVEHEVRASRIAVVSLLFNWPSTGGWHRSHCGAGEFLIAGWL